MATYYVATTGSDSNSGSSGSPFLTIQKGVDVSVPGDTIIVKDGTYLPPDLTVDVMAVRINIRAFTGSPLTIQAQNRLGAVLDGNLTCHSWFEFKSDSAFIVIDGFEITNTRWGGVWANSNGAQNSTVKNCWIHHIGNRVEPSTLGIAGIYTDSGASMTIDNCRFAHVGRTNDAGNSYDHSVYTHGQLTILNNIFLDTPTGWHIQLAINATVLITKNWFFGPNGYDSKSGQIMLWDILGDIAINQNVFYNPRTVAVTSFDMSFVSLSITSNLMYAVLGTTYTDFPGGTLGGNATATLAAFTGTIPSGSGTGTIDYSPTQPPPIPPPETPTPEPPPPEPGTGGGGGGGVPGTGPPPVFPPAGPPPGCSVAPAPAYIPNLVAYNEPLERTGS